MAGHAEQERYKNSAMSEKTVTMARSVEDSRAHRRTINLCDAFDAAPETGHQ